MGMSASQARLIQLEARQSNLEYQGQQINQERTILSQQCTALYNSLLTMQVPTPPSTQDFTSVQYTGKSGATTYRFDATNVKPGKDGLYNLTLGFTDYGNSLTRNNGYAVTSTGYEDVKGVSFNAADTRVSQKTETIKGFSADNKSNTEEAPTEFLVPQSTKPSSGTYYVPDGKGNIVPGGKGYVPNEDTIGTFYVLSNDPAKWNKDTCIDTTKGQVDVTITTNVEPKVTIKQGDLDSLYKLENGIITKAEAGSDYSVDAAGNVSIIGNGSFFLVKDSGTDTAKRGSENGVKIGGYAAMTMEEYKAMFDEKSMDTYNGYCEAIANSGLVDGSGKPYGPEDFYVYLDGNNKPHFALKTDVLDNDTCVTYDYLANGEYTHKTEFDGAKLTFDPATGRITSMDLPVKDNEGNVTSWTTVELEAKTVTDELAYKDAYNDYEYQQEINAKTEIIQQQDRNLELKLQRLDNERQQITTEIEAVQKVIDDNIEASYKTFSG